MKLLVLASNYPYAGHTFSGIFNEKSVAALSGLCTDVKVINPRPYAPALVASLSSRWKAYSEATEYEVRHGISVFRPVYPQIPYVAGGFCHDQAAFLWCRGMAKQLQRRIGFDALLAFDVCGTGAMGWRMGQTLGIPTATWITGHIPPSPSNKRAALRAIKGSSIVFYQSRECLEIAARLLGSSPDDMTASGRHLVLPRGIDEAPDLPRLQIRKRLRAELGIPDDQILVLSIGRIFREKGIFELLEAFSFIPETANVSCIVVGSVPAFDETSAVRKAISSNPALKNRVTLAPACKHENVWEYLCAADIFTFSSHHEGMPNSLLEAMVMGVPAIAFGIPPILELDAGTGALITVKPFDAPAFARAIVELAASSDVRMDLGKRGRANVLDRFMVRKNMAHALDQVAVLVEKNHLS